MTDVWSFREANCDSLHYIQRVGENSKQVKQVVKFDTRKIYSQENKRWEVKRFKPQ
jgi:hypothetical protein